MISNIVGSMRLRGATLAVAVVAGALLPQTLLARDGVSGCSVALIEADSQSIWRYTIELQVPQGAHCRAYVSEDRDRKSWNYCWLKGTPDNPISATCDEPLDDPDFVDWKAKAVCGDQSFTAYCRREP